MRNRLLVAKVWQQSRAMNFMRSVLAVEKGKYSPVSSESKLREQLQREGYSLFSWQDGPGTTYGAHSHPHDEFIVIASGQIIFLIDSERYSLNEGDLLVLPAGTVHEAINEGKSAVRYFICTRH